MHAASPNNPNHNGVTAFNYAIAQLAQVMDVQAPMGFAYDRASAADLRSN